MPLPQLTRHRDDLCDEGVFYVVVRYSDGVEILRTKRLAAAAYALEPGTVFGKGETPQAACLQAMERAKMARGT